MWAWGLARIDTPDHVEMGIDLDSFMARMSAQESVCYFHNLGFDGKFLLYWLLTHDFYLVQEKNVSMAPECFQTLISNMGKFYSIKVRFKNGKTTEFRDSYKKLPMSVAKVAVSFGMEEAKGELDYHAERPVGHILTAEEEDYLRRDVSIVAQAMAEEYDAGMTKLTVASDSMSDYKRDLGTKVFSRMFPVFSDEMDKEIRRAYRGGFTYADPRHTGHVTRGGLVLDVNSLYPYVMRTMILPYGEPRFDEGYIEPTERRPLTIFSVTFTAKLKPKHIPCIQIKGSSAFTPTEYLSEIKEPTTLMVTNIDWELYNDHYDIEVQEYGGGWSFHASDGMFDYYIDKWSEVKANTTGGKREIAKLHLNSLYGKFASNPNVTGKIPVLEDGIVKFKVGREETRAPVYTPVGVFITAYARNLTIRAAQANYNTFAYADTDSLHLLTDTIPDAIDVHPSRIGAWKLEYHFQAAYYIRPKAYMEQTPDGEFVVHIAGLPGNVAKDLTFDSMIGDGVIYGKNAPRNVPGGVVLEPTTFKLK